MKLTPIELKDKIYLLLRAKGLHEEISGRIYKEPRPENSLLEDVEISILDSSARQVQDFTVNVNVFVPDVHRGDEMIEDTPRLRPLCRVFSNALESNVFDGFRIVLEKQDVYKVRDRDIHAINNRLNVSYCSE